MPARVHRAGEGQRCRFVVSCSPSLIRVRLRVYQMLCQVTRRPPSERGSANGVSDHMRQPDLFEEPAGLPAGFRYAEGLITAGEEQDLVREIEGLPFKEFEFHGFFGKRRVVAYGWRYDFNHGGLEKTEDMPDFILAIRERAAEFAGLPAAGLQQVLLTEYRPSAAIGWHKDRSVFGEVVGISLLSPCTFRLRRKAGERWERLSLELQPRSV